MHRPPAALQVDGEVDNAWASVGGSAGPCLDILAHGHAVLWRGVAQTAEVLHLHGGKGGIDGLMGSADSGSTDQYELCGRSTKASGAVLKIWQVTCSMCVGGPPAQPGCPDADPIWSYACPPASSAIRLRLRHVASAAVAELSHIASACAATAQHCESGAQLACRGGLVPLEHMVWVPLGRGSHTCVAFSRLKWEPSVCCAVVAHLRRLAICGDTWQHTTHEKRVRK
jgi:hypothetical protein